jgi:hypothetical protein
MKEFSDYEKKLLQELLRVDETPGGLTVLGNIIDLELYPNYFIELKSETKCPVRIAKTFLDEVTKNYGSSGLNEMIKQLNNKLLFIVKLFQYLEREGQIYLTGEFPFETLGSKFDVSETPVGYELEDAETIKLIYHFSRRKIVPADSLKKFIKNDFKTDTEIQSAKEQTNTTTKLNLALIGILVTLGIGLLTNGLKIFELCKDKGIEKIEITNDKIKIAKDKDTLHIKVEIDKFGDTLNIKTKDNKKHGK